MNVLIVEDDEMSLNMLDILLSDWGYDVKTATAAEPAWEMIRREPPSIIVLDWVLDEMSGLELCRKIRQEKIPAYIIMLTSKSDTEDVELIVKAGADGYIHKPCKQQELLLWLRAGESIVMLQEELAQHKAHGAWKQFTYRLKNGVFGSNRD